MCDGALEVSGGEHEGLLVLAKHKTQIYLFITPQSNTHQRKATVPVFIVVNCEKCVLVCVLYMCECVNL